MFINKIQFPDYRAKGQNYDSDKNQKQLRNSFLKKSLGAAFDYTEEEKKQLNASIARKMKTGAKLTQKELAYLQKTNPVLYTKILMIQKRREMLEQKLKNCKSKEEVDDTIAFEMNSIQKNDPDKELKIKSIQDAEKEFKKTQEYKQLPQTDKEAELKAGNGKKRKNDEKN